MPRTMTRTGFLALLAGAASIAADPARAHHSTAMFEWGKEVTIEGVVASFDWAQPHVWIWFMVPGEAGAPAQRWGIEGMSPSYLSRVGWSKRTLNPGDKVVMQIYPLKDGRKGGFCVRVTLPDGRVLEHVPPRRS